ncbi:MAG: hypothetical protein QM809_11780 [Gordonia sp. (in: high G+C Gram-positive bacteria)]|uniref:hypothetical protein n=1 Tax=Gordonia sp. (in: high G+C Gram-positive bacteria) TaxID=84139 RepID=UPI0039E6E561
MSEELERLQRWTDAGALVRVLSRRGEHLVIALTTCDGGEEMGRLISDDPDVRRWCAEHADGGV